MKYKQALNIGPAEGTIRCTYAVIYDKDKKKLFALQRLTFAAEAEYEENIRKDGNSSFDKSTREDVIVTYTGYGKEGIVGWKAGGQYGAEATGYIRIDMPLVEATEHSDDELVPVKLLYPAVAFIKQSFKGRKLRTLSEYMTQKAAAEGKRLQDATQEQKDKWTEEYAGSKWDRWVRLSEQINDTDIFYVKPAAFVWHPISQYEAEADPRVVEAKEKLDKAKALLMTAGATNII